MDARGDTAGRVPDKRELRRMSRLPDRELESQCRYEAFHAGGPGGQGVNTADSAVRMTHLPTGVTVVCRQERSQLLNRRACLAKIRERLARMGREQRPRKKTSPSRAQRQRRLDEKRRRSHVKSMRGRVQGEQ